MSVPVRAAFVFGSVSIAYASTADLMEGGSSRGAGGFRVCSATAYKCRSWRDGSAKERSASLLARAPHP